MKLREEFGNIHLVESDFHVEEEYIVDPKLLTDFEIVERRSHEGQQAGLGPAG